MINLHPIHLVFDLGSPIVILEPNDMEQKLWWRMEQAGFFIEVEAKIIQVNFQKNTEFYLYNLLSVILSNLSFLSPGFFYFQTKSLRMRSMVT